ncbi:MAG: hypothetical protein J6S67_00325, partial [Methanobrevibacter sp.]|nr:hypothetical protein [Methanobrevibacter sp.]
MNKIKLQPIESASHEYANSIMKAFANFCGKDEKPDETFVEDEKENIAEDFAKGANWVVDVIIHELQNSHKLQNTGDE